MKVQTREEALAFARAWIAAWNRHDLEAVLSHYGEGLVFVSPKAALVAGKPELRSKATVRSYWSAAL